jgi:hypothetical protein
MKPTIFGSLLSGLVLVAPLHAQQVAGDIFIRSGPVAGHVRIGDSYSTYRAVPVVEYRRAPVRRVVVYERRAPRVIVVERVRHQHFRHWKRDGFRRVTLYYVDGRYYDRHLRGRPGVRQIVVYERNGHYYLRHDHRRDRSHDRHGDDWDD